MGEKSLTGCERIGWVFFRKIGFVFGFQWKLGFQRICFGWVGKGVVFVFSIEYFLFGNFFPCWFFVKLGVGGVGFRLYEKMCGIFVEGNRFV